RRGRRPSRRCPPGACRNRPAPLNNERERVQPPRRDEPCYHRATMNRDFSRYHRQMLLPGFGEAGQRRLAESTAVVLGCGALGTVVADMLARAGVGRLIVIDRDYAELTNLQRQVLFDEAGAAGALPKAEAARRKLARINSAVEVEAVVDDINAGNIERYAAGADVLADGLDNFETRYLANDYAVKRGVPYVYGGAVGTTGAA